MRLHDGWKNAIDRAQCAGKSQFAVKLVPPQAASRNLARRDQDADRYREVEAAAALRQIGRSEIDRDLAIRERESGLFDRRLDPFPALLHGSLHEANDD